MEIRGNAAAAASELTQIEKHIRELIGYITPRAHGSVVSCSTSRTGTTD